jgi:hypothetical protein
MGSQKLFAPDGLEPQFFQSQPPKLATISGMSHQHLALIFYFYYYNYYFEIGSSYVTQDGLELSIPLCFSFPIAGITGVHYHAQQGLPLLN